LAAAVGLPALPVCPEPGKAGPATPLIVGSLEKPTPAFDWEKLREAVLERSSEVQEARALALQAVKLLERARADAHPNLLLVARPLYTFISQTPEATVMIGAALPVFNANQGNILAAQADVARTRAEADLVQLRLAERLAAAYQRYLAARRQAAVYQGQVLPAAQEALRLIQLGYERGDPKYDYTAVL